MHVALSPRGVQTVVVYSVGRKMLLGIKAKRMRLKRPQIHFDAEQHFSGGEDGIWRGDDVRADLTCMAFHPLWMKTWQKFRPLMR